MEEEVSYEEARKRTNGIISLLFKVIPYNEKGDRHVLCIVADVKTDEGLTAYKADIEDEDIDLNTMVKIRNALNNILQAANEKR